MTARHRELNPGASQLKHRGLENPDLLVRRRPSCRHLERAQKMLSLLVRWRSAGPDRSVVGHGMMEPTLGNVPALEISGLEIKVHPVFSLGRNGNRLARDPRRTGTRVSLLRCRRRFLQRRFETTQRFPGRSAGCRGKLDDGHVLDLHQCHPAGVNLGSDHSIESDVGVLLGVVRRQHVIDPDADSRPLRADPIFVPAVDIDDLRQCLGIDRLGDDRPPAIFVIDFPEPTRTTVDLVASHVGATGHPLTAHLDPAVDQACFGITAALDRQLQFEILEGALGREEEVLRDLLRSRSPGDDAVLHAPDLGIVVPAFERFPVEKRDRFGGLLRQCRGGENQGQQRTRKQAEDRTRRDRRRHGREGFDAKSGRWIQRAREHPATCGKRRQNTILEIHLGIRCRQRIAASAAPISKGTARLRMPPNSPQGASEDSSTDRRQAMSAATCSRMK